MARARREGIQVDGTLQVVLGSRDQKVQNPDEERITNAMIKLTKNVTPVLCSISGHGEKDFDAAGEEGYDFLKKTLNGQGYETKKIVLTQTGGKVPAECSGVAILGPNSAWFEPETKALREYLAGGGSAFVALDLNLKGPNFDPTPDLTKLLSEWGVVIDAGVIVDPSAQIHGFPATFPIVSQYSKENPITKDLLGDMVFPLTRPIRIAKELRPGLKVQWLAQTSPNAWGETDLAALGKGKAQFDTGKDQRGPLYAAVAVDAKAEGSATQSGKKNTRIVVVGTSLVGSNPFVSRKNNLDLSANAVSWLFDDDTLISIRAREEEGGVIQLSAVQARLIGLVTVLLVPLLMVIFGVAVWIRRKKL
jgi:ABC-type uncharacterized transport system involved in gliding motility auxiliary subunit